MDIDVSLEDSTLVFTEGNAKFSVRVEPSRSNQMLFIVSGRTSGERGGIECDSHARFGAG